MTHLDQRRRHNADLLRLHRAAEHLHRMPSRVTAEALAEIATPAGMARALEILAGYSRIYLVELRATGADRAIPAPLRRVA